MHKSISSLQNPIIKQFLLLQEKSRERRKQSKFVLEGVREIGLALEAGYVIDTLFYCETLVSRDQMHLLQQQLSENTQLIQVSDAVYERMAYRGSTEGMLALVHQQEHGLGRLNFSNDRPLVLVAEAPEKPGNIGALLRTADAANLDAVIIANPKTDVYNPNIIRSSVGCLFSNTVVTGTTEEIIAFLKEKNIAIYCAALQASQPYHQMNFQEPCAIVVGTEATGLSEAWLDHSDQNIIIPMQGAIDSMNVSVAAGILIFEAKRQRNFS